jgi:hypothetical protein
MLIHDGPLLVMNKPVTIRYIIKSTFAYFLACSASRACASWGYEIGVKIISSMRQPKAPAWQVIRGTMQRCEAKENEVLAEAARYDVGYARRFTVETTNGVQVFVFRWRLHPSPRPICGAKCRSGRPCQAKVAYLANGDWATRCKRHGGLSTGPKTDKGRARQKAAVSEANSRRKGTAYKKRTLLAPPARQEKPAAPLTLAELAARELERREKLGIL